MKHITLLLVCLGFSASAFGAYDDSWYQADFWAYEYPNGFSVVKKNAKVVGRTGMDKELAQTVSCALPYRAVFQPWNNRRNAKNKVNYFTASKIVKLVAKEDFTYTPFEEQPIEAKKGQEFEYLIYNSEGYFSARMPGREFQADQDFLDKMEPVAETAFQQDEWLRLRCENGKTAWLLLGDLRKTDAEGEFTYLPGLADVGPGLTGYGSARDLTEKEARELAKP